DPGRVRAVLALDGEGEVLDVSEQGCEVGIAGSGAGGSGAAVEAGHPLRCDKGHHDGGPLRRVGDLRFEHEVRSRASTPNGDVDRVVDAGGVLVVEVERLTHEGGVVGGV